MQLKSKSIMSISINNILKSVDDFTSLLYPHRCYSCGNNLTDYEKYICFDCLYSLPRTNFHLEKDNPVNRLFWGRVNIFSACSFFHFHKGGNLQTLIHKLKYEGRKEIGEELGQLFGVELYKSADYSTVDLIIPVPLNEKKQKSRGYNQSTQIANGIAQSINADVCESCLIRPKHGETQTNKTRYERWENVKSAFQLAEPSYIEKKHVLLIDDVVTTGSTLEACANTILSTPGTIVSIATLAMA